MGEQMTWTVPEVSRVDEPFAAGERAILEGFLEWHRATLLWKCAGLTGEQLPRRPVPPSSLSLLGLVRHMADVERAWFRRYLRGYELAAVYERAGRSDAAFEEARSEAAEAGFAHLTAESGLARTAAADLSLDSQFTYQGHGPYSLRWV